MERTVRRTEEYVFDDKDIIKLEDRHTEYILQLGEILRNGDSEKYMNHDIVKFVADKYIKINQTDSRDTIVAKMAIRKMLYVDVFVHNIPDTTSYFRNAKGKVPELPLLALATAAAFSRPYELGRDMHNDDIVLMTSTAMNIKNQDLDRTQIAEDQERRATFKFALHYLEEKWEKEYLNK